MSPAKKQIEGFRFLEHVTDAFIEVWAPNIERAFALAGLAFFDTMIYVERVDRNFNREIRAEGHDELELLYNWLEALLIRFEVDNETYSEFSLKKIREGREKLHLTARASGESYDPAKHGTKIGVKGVTYHQMSIERKPGRIDLRFLLDL